MFQKGIRLPSSVVKHFKCLTFVRPTQLNKTTFLLVSFDHVFPSQKRK